MKKLPLRYCNGCGEIKHYIDYEEDYAPVCEYCGCTDEEAQRFIVATIDHGSKED